MRLDQRLVDLGHAPTRSRARDLIMRGFVLVDGVRAAKPAQGVPEAARITLRADAPQWVSRGAEKLVAALDHFGLDVNGRRALDVGASTGGFTQVLLERGAAHVTAVDVGKGQFDPGLRENARVRVLEQRDARSLTGVDVGAGIDAIVADVSFISLQKVLPAVLDLAQPGAWLVTLVKPQFEVGRERIGKGGIVRDEAAQREAVDAISTFIGQRPGWRIKGNMPSPIAGGSGNREFLIAAILDG